MSLGLRRVEWRKLHAGETIKLEWRYFTSSFSSSFFSLSSFFSPWFLSLLPQLGGCVFGLFCCLFVCLCLFVDRVTQYTELSVDLFLSKLYWSVITTLWNGYEILGLGGGFQVDWETLSQPLPWPIMNWTHTWWWLSLVVVCFCSTLYPLPPYDTEE